MSEYFISLHIDPPVARRLPVTWDDVVDTVTQAPSTLLGRAFVGLHDGTKSRFVFLGPKNEPAAADAGTAQEMRPQIIETAVRDGAGLRADHHFYLPTSQENFDKIGAFVDRSIITPPNGGLGKINCVKFAKAALEVGGLTIPVDATMDYKGRRQRCPVDLTHTIQHLEKSVDHIAFSAALPLGHDILNALFRARRQAAIPA